MFEYLTDIIKVITDTDEYFNDNKIIPVFLNYIKNGLYIPIVYIGLLFLTENLFLSTVITVKLYPANHWYWFSHTYSYNNIPKQYNFVKQFVRMTDTGHLVSLLYLMDSSYLPLAHNVHFFITIGFWTGKVMGSFDQDVLIQKPDSGMIHWYQTVWSSVSHGLPYLLFLREIWISDQCFVFDMHTLWISYRWIYVWLVTVYIPWRFYTGDVIYTILDIQEDRMKQMKFIGGLHLGLIVANIVGYMLTAGICVK